LAIMTSLGVTYW